MMSDGMVSFSELIKVAKKLDFLDLQKDLKSGIVKEDCAPRRHVIEELQKFIKSHKK
jgi:hypothetical protein